MYVHRLVHEVRRLTSWQKEASRVRSPLVLSESHPQALRDDKGRCLNYYGTDHAFKHCPHYFTNSSGVVPTPNDEA